MTQRLWLAGIPATLLALVLAWEVTAPGNDSDGTTRQPAADAEHQGVTQSVTTRATDRYAKAVDTILARPLFSVGRRRAAPPAIPVAEKAESVPRLSGIVIGASERHAIFADADGHSHIVSEGMLIGSFTVTAIEPGQVILTSSKGVRVLHTTYPKAAPSDPVRTTDAAPRFAVEAERQR